MAEVQAATARQPAEDPLLGDQEAANMHGDREEEEEEDNNVGGSFSWLAFLGFLFLTLNSAMAIVRSRGDTMAVAFVSFSYADLVALFVCLRMYERAAAGSAKREWLKIAVWVLTTLLTLAFSYKVAAVMPAPVAVLVWLMAFATVAGGFVAFFVYKEKK
jgi:cation transport ATPase